MNIEYAKNSLRTTRISSFKYVFIVFLKKKQMLKYTFIIIIILDNKKMYAKLKTATKSILAANDNLFYVLCHYEMLSHILGFDVVREVRG